ncbi:MAG: hypothetical protein ACLFQB_04160 [Chitinispirillaceae bacterium]
MKKTFLTALIAMLTFSCGDSTSPEEKDKIEYRYNSGAVPPQYSFEYFYTFYSDGTLNYKKTDSEGTVLEDVDYQSGETFYSSLVTFITQHDIEGLNSQYHNPEMAGHVLRGITIETENISKMITITGYWEEGLPDALWQLEEMITNRIDEVESWQ